MDLFEIKKDIENFTIGIEEIRGHLWSRTTKQKDRCSGRKDAERKILG